MELLDKIRNDRDVCEKLDKFCGFLIYPKEEPPEDEGGSLAWNIHGMAFANDGMGLQYILLDDNSIGCNSAYGDNGRIAENITEIFELLINISDWQCYLSADLYSDDKLLEKHIAETETEIDKDTQEELSKKLGLRLYENKMDVLKRFYKTAKREPLYSCTCTEIDGTKYKSEGTVIN